jgi:hypothetical protein
MEKDGGEVEAKGRGGGCASGRDGGCAEWIFGEEVYAVLEGPGEGVDLEYEGIKGLRGYGIKEKRCRKAGGMKGGNDFALQLRDALTRAYTWLRSGGGRVAFGDGNPFEPLA